MLHWCQEGGLRDYKPEKTRFRISRLQDPSIERIRRHNLIDIVMLMTSTLIRLIDEWEEIK